MDRKYNLQLRVFQFLMGLNPEYESLRSQLIHRENALTFKGAVRSARIEESRLKKPSHASAFLLQSSPQAQPFPAAETAPRDSTHLEASPKGDSSLFCNYCKKRGHSKETCFKLQRKRSQQSHLAASVLPTDIQSFVSPLGQVPMPYGLLPTPLASSSSLSQEEIERLRRLLDSPVVDSCSLAHEGTSTALSTPPSTSASSSLSWIVDSGATSHMTPNPHWFISYDPSPGTTKVRTASSDLLTVAGIGLVSLSPSITLSRVLHVPPLACHLLSLSHLVRNLGHDLTFSPNTCFYRDKVSGKMTTLAEEHQGLYLVRPSPSAFVAAGMSSSASHERLWLLHRRLGHPSFVFYFLVYFMVILLTVWYVMLVDSQNIIVLLILLLVLRHHSLLFIVMFGVQPLLIVPLSHDGWLYLLATELGSHGLTLY